MFMIGAEMIIHKRRLKSRPCPTTTLPKPTTSSEIIMLVVVLVVKIIIVVVIVSSLVKFIYSKLHLKFICPYLNIIELWLQNIFFGDRKRTIGSSPGHLTV